MEIQALGLNLMFIPIHSAPPTQFRSPTTSFDKKKAEFKTKLWGNLEKDASQRITRKCSEFTWGALM